MRVTGDEADSMAVACAEGKCWAVAGQFCRTPSGTRRRPHPLRVDEARTRGMLGGAGRVWLSEQGARDDGGTVHLGGTTLILPPGEAVSGAC